MSNFDISEFMEQEEEKTETAEAVEQEEISETDEIDIQKEVVKSLAEEKIEIEHLLEKANGELSEASQKIAGLEAELAEKNAEIAKLAETIKDAEKAKADAEAVKEECAREREESSLKIKALEKELALSIEKIGILETKELDTQERNPNALALLDRDVEIPDRFPGETRDHVLEAIASARDEAEKEGRVRKAQMLESVLVANEPNGNLAKRRSELAALFEENGNIINGAVLQVLSERGISSKNGEEYLLPSEILKRTY